MRIKNLSEIIDILRDFLPEYLESFGRDANSKTKKFQCPNESAHRNGDRNPSANLVKGSQSVWHCFACGESGDIFRASHYLEGFEIKGKGFIETVCQLAERFEIPIEEDVDAEDLIRANEQIAEIIKRGLVFPALQTYIESRTFDSIADIFGIGYARPEKLYERMLDYCDADFMNRHQIVQNALFRDRMVFPIHDENGEVVGFAGRTLVDDKRKYINSSNSLIFQKSQILYNLHRIHGNHVYVVEGYADVWRLHQNLLPAVACCGTAFTEEHLNALKRNGIDRVTFVFDGDEAGQKALERTLKIIENFSGINFGYITLSAKKGEKDPDEFITKYGRDEFLLLERVELEEPKKKKLEQFLNRLIELEERYLDPQPRGFLTGWKEYDSQMERVQPGLHLVGGVSNIGKTAWMMNMAIRLAKANPDLFVYYVSIDDDLYMTIPRIVSVLGQLPVNMAKNPHQFIDMNPYLSPEDKQKYHKKREFGNRALFEMAKNKNFAVVDINDLSKLSEIEREVKIFQELTGKSVALFVDNFHKLRSDRDFHQIRERFTHLSEELKRITIENELVTFSTVELSKLGHNSRPQLESIKESVDIIYDANTIHMLHQDYHSKGGMTPFRFIPAREFGLSHKYDFLPILEVNVAKNKLSGWKGRVYFEFYTPFMLFRECTPEQQEHFRNIDLDDSDEAETIINQQQQQLRHLGGGTHE